MVQIHIKHLGFGDVLMEEGSSENSSMYWVQTGSFRLTKKTADGVVELGIVKSGEIIGEFSFLDKQARSATATAIEISQVVEIPRGNFEKIIAEQPPWMASLIQTLVKRLRATNARVGILEAQIKDKKD